MDRNPEIETQTKAAETPVAGVGQPLTGAAPTAGSSPAMGEAMADRTVWFVGWAVGMAAAAALLLLAGGAISIRFLLALGIMALLGLAGAAWRTRMQPSGPERPPIYRLVLLLALWAAGSVLAVSIAGGLAGPLAVLCLTPVLVALVEGEPAEGAGGEGAAWMAGAGFAIVAALACALVAALTAVTPIDLALPYEPARSGLTLIALLAVAAAAAGALLVVQRRAAQASAAAERELTTLQTVLGDLPELALAMTADGAAEAVFGQPLDGVDLAALHLGLLHAAEPAERPRLEAAMAKALAEGSARTVFTPLGAPGAEETQASRRIAVTLQRTGAGGLTAILRQAPPPPAPALPSPDLTHRLAAAEAARQAAETDRDKAEASAASRARFLANMSHELRTPLNAIMGFSDMMRARMFGELQPKYAEYAELIHESGDHLLDLINDVLDMSKLEAERYALVREVFDARDALNGALRLVRLQADEAGVRLRALLPPDPLMIDADRRAIKQIALNLLSNALKFTPRDGAVILTAKAQAGALELMVADTGAGIAAKDLERLGRPFEQAGEAGDRARGTGLGLSLVDAFARLHGGALRLESRLGEGTAAIVRLPVLAPPGAAPPPAGAADADQAALEPRAELEPQPQHEPGPDTAPSVVDLSAHRANAKRPGA